MPYPREEPKVKHDLACPMSLPKTGPLADSDFCYGSTSELFKAIEQGAAKDLKQIGFVYSFPDGPDPDISRALVVTGFADTSLKVARMLMHSDAAPVHKCTIAVRRGDGKYGDQLQAHHAVNSPRFANFMKRIRDGGLVAIVGADKYNRIGLLAPIEQSNGDHSDGYVQDDFYAELYVGKVDEIKQFLAGRASAPTQPEPDLDADDGPTFVPTTPPMDDDGPTWKPPEEDDGGDGPTWKPPEEENNNGGGFWKPPGSDSGDGGGFGGGGENGAFWQPPSSEAQDNGFDTWEPPSRESGQKRSYDAMENGGDLDDEKFHSNKGAAAADAFYSGLTRDLDTRDKSRIFHMRNFNGWVKATQIQELDPKTKYKGKGMRVLDLACGKGGDLGKWAHHKRGIDNYVGVDVARGSLKDAAIRARKMRRKLSRCTFTCADLGADVPGRYRSKKHQKLQKLLSWSLQGESDYETQDPDFQMVRGGGISVDDKFDVISIQFAIHYMFQERQRARRFFQTVSELLEVGGNLVCTTIDARVVIEKLMDLGLNLHFDDDDEEEEEEGKEEEPEFEDATVAVGDGACKIKFQADVVKRIFKSLGNGKFDSSDLFGLEYSFTLVEGSDHAAGVGDAVNLPEWLNPIPVLETLAEEAGLELVVAENFHEFYNNRKDPSTNPAAHEALYNMKVLDRNGTIVPNNWEISRMYVAIKFRKVRESSMQLDDDGVADDNEEDEPQPAPKPAVDPKKAKAMYPMAMKRAKQAAGAETWSGLSGEEKKTLIDAQLSKMLS